MDFVIKSDFSKQLNTLLKKYDKVLEDFDYFKQKFDILEGKHLGKGIYKSEIPPIFL